MINRIKEDIKNAMRNKEKTKLSTLRMLLATIETERGKQGLESIENFSEEQIISLINRNVKALNQESDSLLNVGRDNSNVLEQKDILIEYLPKQLSEDEIRKEVAYALTLLEQSRIDNAMKYLSQKLKGKADLGLVSKLIKEISKK